MGVFRKPIGDMPRKSKGMGGGYGKFAKRRRFEAFLKQMFKYTLILGTVGFLVLTVVIIQISSQLPDVDIISTYVPNETTKIYSSDGETLAELHQEENRALVPSEKISPFVKAAVVATEDSEFFHHHGVNVKAIFRASLTNLVAGSTVQGASTITQQLARNVFLHRRKLYVRKIAETILALQLERRYTKEEILEFYLNQVYWGHNAYGIESSARLYFNKSAEVLSMAEAALLVGLLRGPELYSPFVNPRRAKWRQGIVLGRLLALGLITQEEYFDAREEPIFLASRRQLRYKAPYFTTYVVKQLIQMYGEDVVYNNGLRVYTTIDMELQEYAEESLEFFMMEASKPHWIQGEEVSSLNATQGALLSLEPTTGYIKAWVGGRDFLEKEFDHIVQAKRQPGSAFKPYTYLTALNMGLSPGTILEDTPVTFNTIEGPYSPTNYTRDFRGPVTMRRALELSLNIPAIKVSDLIDPSNIIVTCRKLGISGYLAPVLSLTLGASEISMLEQATAYSVIANGGVRVDPVSILRIEDRNGNVLYQHDIVEERVFDRNKTYALVDMMKGVMTRGTGRGANIPGYDLAGKTGTTNSFRDAWFIGFSPNLLTASWVGNSDNSPMNNVTGGWIPAQMWRRYMGYALPKLPRESFPMPRGMVRQRICVEGKALATESCPPAGVVDELMWADKVYTHKCTTHSFFSGLSPVGGSARTDWERTFYPDVNRLVYIDVSENKEDKKDEIATKNSEVTTDRDRPKVDMSRGL